MRLNIWPTVALVAVACLLAIPSAAPAAQREKLEMYVLEGPADKVAEAARGLELRDVEHSTAGTKAEAVLTERQATKIRAQGVTVSLLRNGKGQTVSEQAALQALDGFNVWRSWDEPGGIRDELYDLAASNSDLVKLEVLGHTHQGREIIALRVTDSWRALDRRRASGRRCCTRRCSTRASGSASRSTGGRCTTSSTATAPATPRSASC